MTFRSFFALYASKIRLPLNAQPGFSTLLMLSFCVKIVDKKMK